MSKIYQKSKTIMIIKIKECIMWHDAGVANVVQLVKSDKKIMQKSLRHYKMKTIYTMESVVRFSTEELICYVF